MVNSPMASSPQQDNERITQENNGDERANIPPNTTNTNGTPKNIEEFIEWLKVTPSETVLQHGGIAKLDRMKEVARRLKLSTKQGKKELYENIMKHFEENKHLDELGVGSSSSDGYISKSWHIIRIINCIFWDGDEQLDALSTSCALATRDQLQSHETGENHPVWVKGADNFNAVDYNSGSFRVDSEKLFISEEEAREHGPSYDPEQPRQSRISPKIMRAEFNKYKKKYQSSVERWTASGKHNGGEAVFCDFCNHDIGQIYLFHVLKLLGNPELDSFIGEGAVVQGGVDTAARASDSRQHTERNSRKRSKQKHDVGSALMELTHSVPKILASFNPNENNGSRIMELGELQSQIASVQQQMTVTREDIRREKQQDIPDELFLEDLEEEYKNLRKNYRRLSGYLENAHRSYEVSAEMANTETSPSNWITPRHGHGWSSSSGSMSSRSSLSGSNRGTPVPGDSNHDALGLGIMNV